MAEDLPFVSVVVPMRNEQRFIERCLRSLMAQNYPQDRFEVIVVDGGSDDGSRDILESLRSEFTSLRVVANRGRHTGRGLNIGLALSQGDVIARLDAPASAPPRSTRTSVPALARTRAAVPRRYAAGADSRRRAAASRSSPGGTYPFRGSCADV